MSELPYRSESLYFPGRLLVIYPPYGPVSSHISPQRTFPQSCRNTLIDMCEKGWVVNRNRRAGLADNVI